MPPTKPVARGALLSQACEESTFDWKRTDTPTIWRLGSTRGTAFSVFVGCYEEGFRVLWRSGMDGTGDHRPQVAGLHAGADIETAKAALAHGEKVYAELEETHRA